MGTRIQIVKVVGRHFDPVDVWRCGVSTTDVHGLATLAVVGSRSRLTAGRADIGRWLEAGEAVSCESVSGVSR
jgi:hypothetical protein